MNQDGFHNERFVPRIIIFFPGMATRPFHYVPSAKASALSKRGRYIDRLKRHRKSRQALIRPGRIDKKVRFKLADEDIAAQFFRTVFKHPPDSKQLKEDVDEEMVDRLAEDFVTKLPEHVFRKQGWLEKESGVHWQNPLV